MDRRPAHRVRAEPNVTPMIDVMLVLLVIFMLVVPALVAGGTAVPPRSEHLTARPDLEQPQLTIDARGAYTLDGRPVARLALPDSLRALLAARTVDRTVYVTADGRLDYGVVQGALAGAAAAGASRVGLVTEQMPRARGNP